MNWLIFTVIGAFVAMGIHRMSRDAQNARSFSRGKGEKDAISAQEMVQCPVCQTYVVKNAFHCGREDCLYPKRPGA